MKKCILRESIPTESYSCEFPPVSIFRVKETLWFSLPNLS